MTPPLKCTLYIGLGKQISACRIFRANKHALVFEKKQISLFSFPCFNFENCCAISYLNLVGAVELKVVKPHGETTPLGVAHAICALLGGDGSGLIFFENNFSTDLVRWVVLDSISR